jgi:hypothetical protein
MVTRSCTQHQFLLRPDPETNNAFIYCLAIAAERYGVTVLDFIQMSNHLHDVVYDRYGNLPEFTRHFHSLLAKCINCIRGRSEGVFSTDQVNVVVLEDSEAIVDKLCYVATNAVKDHLVETADKWPGACGHRALVERRILRATRPKQFFSATSSMPATITLELTIPSELGDAQAILHEVVRRVAQRERDAAQERAASGRKVLGRNAVLRQSWRESPVSRLPRRGLRPTFAGRLWARVEAAQRNYQFVASYRLARAAFLAGSPIRFPAGTYWMHRYVGAVVDSFEKLN